MSLGIRETIVLLKEHHLLKSVNVPDNTIDIFNQITYNSQTVREGALFCCKGNFKPEYLTSAKEKGAFGYVSESHLAEGSGLAEFIVTDIQKSMALLGAAFYDYPQNDLFIVAFTGTKGKTTSAYFSRGILQKSTQEKTALFSTIDRFVGSKPDQHFKSHLTTPESLGLFHDMRTAVNNGMTHLVMEVSSQAYKKNRVYNLKYDVGVFLNISPDHIGANEHPTFADYLHCKEQLLVNSKICVINAETDHLEDVYEAAKATSQPDDIYLFARKGGKKQVALPLDFEFENQSETLHGSNFTLRSISQKAKELSLDNQYELSLPGDYNESNAASAIIASGLAGAGVVNVKDSLDKILVPGRMEFVKTKNHGTVYIDYAHNYGSMKSLLAFLRKQTNAGRVIALTGSTGNKGESRRKGFGQALSEEADVAFLTADDPAFESPQAIAEEIDSYIDHDKVEVHFNMDRISAIKEAIQTSTNQDIVVLAGKGEDAYQKVDGVDTPYPTDVTVAREVVKEIEND